MLDGEVAAASMNFYFRDRMHTRHAAWAEEFRALPFEAKLVRRETMPNFPPSNPKFAMAIKLWRKIPLEITRHVGPRN